MARTAKTTIRIQNAGVLLGSGFDTLNFNSNISGSDSGNGVVLINATGGGSTGTPVPNEVVSGSGTSWTLANTPIVNSVALYANGQRLTPTVDYSISVAAITTVLSWAAGTIIADYSK